MDMKPLGPTGVMLPEIGLGTWRHNGSPEVIRRALELGAPFIDTAESYKTETGVGNAIRGNRDKYFMATKVSPEHFKHKDVLKAADASLKKLGIDQIDLYQLHWPNPRVPIAETMGAMAELVQAGKVRLVGVSNFSVEQTEAARQALGSVPLVSNQVLYSLFDREIEQELIPYCAAHQITVIAYSPLAQGKIDHELGKRPKLATVLDAVCAETEKTRAQVLLNWCVRHPSVVTIPQTNKVERVDENCAASGWQLTQEQYDALSETAGF